MRVKHGGLVLMFAATLGFAACTTSSSPDPTEQAEQALEQANLNDVDVDWDQEARVAHLTGTVESPADRQRAEEVATAAVGTTGKVLNEVTIKGLNESTADNIDGQIQIGSQADDRQRPGASRPQHRLRRSTTVWSR